MTRTALLAAAAATLVLSGCSSQYQALTPELQASMLSDLQAGKLALQCHAGCTLSWLTQAPSIHQLDIAEKWNDLAVRVMQIGYASDLSYYYLGQSAQGLGYHQAAIAYYSESMQLNTGPNPLAKCATLQSAGSDPCQGVDIASSLPVLIQASRDVLAQQQADAAAAEAQAQAAAAPVHHHHHRTATASSSSATGSGATGGSGWVAPPPPATAQPASAQTGGSGWVAPPPANQ